MIEKGDLIECPIPAQTERAFQKQPTVFLNKKKNVLVGKTVKVPRHVKSVGLGFKTPREVR